MLPTGTRADLTPAADAAAPVGQGFTVTPSDLAFILKQIQISERHSRALIPELDPGNLIPNNPSPTTDPVYCQSMIGTGADQIPSSLLSFGLRTVRGDCNNLIPGQSHYGAADTVFPRHATPAFKAGEAAPPGFPAASPGGYTSTRGFVYDTEPRTISNLIVDQTVNNPAAVQAAGYPIRSQGNEGVFSCVGVGERQTISGTPSGPFTITFDGQTTGTLAPGASAATVQAALEALSNLAPGDVTVTGSLASSLLLRFSSSLGDVPQVSLGAAAAITGLSLVTDTEGALGSPAVAGTSEVVTIEGVSVNDFILTFGGNSTATILAGASALDVEAALNAAPVNAGVTVVDGTSPATYVITFTAHGNAGPITTDSAEQTISEVDGTADVAAVPDTSEVQTLSGTASASFALDLGGPLTGSIAPNASAAAIQSALSAITTATATDGPLPAAVTVTFDGALGNVPALTANSVPLADTTPSTLTNGVVANAAGCVPPDETLFIPNITTDVGLSPPFNSLFTIFGQFFDHGVDFTSKGKSGTVFVPLKADDPLRLSGPDGIPGNGDEVSPSAAFMVLTRATNQPGPDGITGDLPLTAIDESADDIHDATNRDSPFVDQSQTYTSHSSHQIFLREFVDNNAGRPVATGKLISLPDGGQAPWSLVKSQAASLLGIQLVDTDVFNVPMIYADPYGNFIPGPLRGLPQLMLQGGGLLEGDRAGGGVLVPSNALRIDTAFLDDIAHNAVPDTFDDDNNPATPPVQKQPDADTTVGTTALGAGAPAPGFYDNELLDAHFLSGDGRLNENIALTAVHQIFHSEHDRLVEDIKSTLLADTSGLTHLTDWQTPAGAADANGVWNGARLFQAARFVTEMEYQHLVFEEFARKIQPLINPFEPFAFNQTDTNASVRAEFAHAVYRFGHSMLDETIPRVNAAGVHDDIKLLDGFLNPAEYHSGPGNTTISSQEAATNIIMGLSDQAGNEIDEFVTNTLRNNLLGLPLDLPTINMTRARSEGIPSLNEFRRQIFAETNDGSMQPYGNWIDWGLGLKHPESLVNFVAAYGQHPSIVGATTLAGKREAARLIVAPEIGDPPVADADDFMGSTGPWANVETGINLIDLWVGGLAERTDLFGGHLGLTFNYVFEAQLTDLQNGDRLYYLARTPGMNLRTQLEGNSFAELVMRNTDAHTLKADAFATADCKFELGRLVTPATSGAILNATSVQDDPLSECNENAVLIHMPDGTFRYREINSEDPPGINAQSVYNGTAGSDRIHGGNDNDTFLGNEGNDTIEGAGGSDIALGGDGDDVITDNAGDDVPKGGPGNDAIDAGPGLDIIMAGTGNDFTNGGANINETFAGAGNDFVIAGQSLDAVFGDSGDDWIEGGDQPDLLQGDSGNLFFKDTGNPPGNDVQIGQAGDDDYDHEGGDDIGVAGPGIEKIAGGAGYDWQIGLGENAAQNMDLNLKLVGLDALVIDVRDKFNEVEALSGWKFNDTLKGEDVAPAAVGGGGFVGCDALDPAGVARIAGLNALVSTFPSPLQPILDSTSVGICPLVGQGAGPGNAGNVWGEGDILLGGSGNDSLEGRGANDILDGDRYMNVRISVRAGVDANGNATGAEIGTTDLMEHTFQVGNPMTLQQAVFARQVNPGQLVVVRELLNDAPSTDVDTALFSGSLAEYVITQNGDGSVTVDHQGGADGVDTLWNMELLRFCDAVDANGVCTAPVIVPASGVTPGTPTLSVTPTSTAAAPVQFGTVAVGAAPAVQNITVSNTGGGTLNVTNVTLTTGQATQFSILSNGCAGNPVGGGGSCVIQVGFQPTLAPILPLTGVRTAQLNITTNATNNVTFLRGIRAVVAALTTATIDTPTDFGTRRIGEPRTRIVKVTNDGAANNLTVTGVSTTGPFTATNVDCTNVLPGRTCRLSVTFNPTAPLAAKTGTVRIQGNVSNAVTPGVLTGTSKAAAVAVAALRIVQPPAPTSVRPVNVSLRVSTAATVRVQVRKPNGKLVWSKVTKVKKAGASRVRWNLRDSKGRKVKKGSYRFTITVTDASGAKVVIKKSVRVR